MLSAKICERKAHQLLFRSWQFGWGIYAEAKGTPQGCTRQAMRLFEWMRLFRSRLLQQISSLEKSEKLVDPLLSMLLSSLVELIRDAEEPLWRHNSSFSKDSVWQFAVDMRWIQEAASKFGWLEVRTNRMLESCVQRAVLEFCAQKGVKDPSSVLPKPDWFKEVLGPQVEALARSSTSAV